jgi:hypothetical protein
MVNNTTGVLIPTTFDIATRVRYNAKTTFGPNNEVYFARVIDYNTVNSPVPNRSALEVLQFDANQNRKSQKRYFDTPKRDTDTLPQVEDMLVATNGTLYVAGARLKKTWLLSYKDTASGASNVPQQNTSTTIRQVSRVPNSPNIAIEIESPSNKTVTLEIVNTLNQVVRTQQPNLQQGINTIQIGFGNQPNGTYIAKLTTAGNSSTYTFVKM